MLPLHDARTPATFIPLPEPSAIERAAIDRVLKAGAAQVWPDGQDLRASLTYWQRVSQHLADADARPAQQALTRSMITKILEVLTMMRLSGAVAGAPCEPMQ